MKLFQPALYTTLMLSSLAIVDAISFDLGPFSLQFGGYSRDYRIAHRNALDGPICFAIAHKTRLEVTLEVIETVSSKEQKFITKNLVIEPYAFGVSNDDRPILQGNIVKEELIKEVTVKFGEDRFDISNPSSKSSLKDKFATIFSSAKIKDLDISKVIHITIIPDVHFEAPSNFKGMDEKAVEVICQLPVAK